MMPYASYKPSGVPWLGDVPAHWQIEKVKFQARLRGEKAVGTNGARYVGMEHVLSKVGKFSPMVDGTQEEAESTVNVFSKGDVLFGKLRPYLAKCVVADTDGVCSSEFLVLSPSDEVVPAYLNATMLMQEFIDAVDASTYGAKMPRADWGFIGQQRLPLPPPDEQQAIADYLDVETARIDTLIHEKDGLIGLLREWRQSVIAEAVTKGLDKTVALKPSGVPWLGDVPGHWNVQRIKRLSPVRRGASPRPIDDPIYFDDNGRYGWVRIEDVTRSNGTLTETSQYLSELGASLSVKLPPGRLFLSIAGSVGKPCISGRDVCIHDGFVYFPDLEVNIRWMFGIFESGLPFQGLGKMGTQLNLNTQTVGDIFLGTPPADEQQAIADYLDTETTKIDGLIAHTHDEITLLKELRAATIADAVLGRIDVRGSAKPLAASA